MASEIHVAVIEDEPNDRILIEREILRANPQAKVTQVGSLEELEVLLQSCEFDAVVLDYALGWSDGLSVMKLLRSRCPDRPVVMFSGATIHEEAIEAMRVGLDEFVYKAPDQFVYLPVAIRNALGHAKQREQVRETQRLAVMGRHSAMIAHEINNQLSSLVDLHYLMATDDQMRQETREWLEKAKHEVQRIESITRKTLAFHRGAETMKPVSMSLIVAEVLGLFERRLQINGLTLSSDLEDTPEVKGFAAELRQVFVNLIGNAIEATPKGGRLRVCVRNASSWKGSQQAGVSVMVCDTGSGIARETLSRLFQPFFTTKGESGTGLGLWVSKGIIEKHHGAIRIKSRVGSGESGTCMRVFLPQATIRQSKLDAAPFSQSADANVD